MNIGSIYDRILESLRAQFPEFATVDDYRELGEDRTTLAVPALLVELTDLERSPADDPATGQKAVVGIFEATIVLGFRAPDVDRAVRSWAGALITFIDGQRWGVPGAPSLVDVLPARVTVAGPHAFTAVTGSLLAWRIEWRQVMFLGEDEDVGVLPQTVLASWAPEIGPDHKDAYRPIEQVAGLGGLEP